LTTTAPLSAQEWSHEQIDAFVKVIVKDAPPDRWDVTHMGHDGWQLADKVRFDKSEWPIVTGWVLFHWVTPHTMKDGKIESFTILRQTVDCAGDRLQLLQIVNYDAKRHVIKSGSTTTPDWNETVPGSLGEALLTDTCAYWETHDPGRASKPPETVALPPPGKR